MKNKPIKAFLVATALAGTNPALYASATPHGDALTQIDDQDDLSHNVPLSAALTAAHGAAIGIYQQNTLVDVMYNGDMVDVSGHIDDRNLHGTTPIALRVTSATVFSKEEAEMHNGAILGLLQFGTRTHEDLTAATAEAVLLQAQVAQLQAQVAQLQAQIVELTPAQGGWLAALGIGGGGK